MATNLSNLQRVALVHNTALSRVGIKHYAHALMKYNITPTAPGPFQVFKEIEEIESSTAKPAVIQQLQHSLGIKKQTHTHHILCKSNATGQTGRVTAQDVDQGSEYLAPVTIGTPGKTFNLDFDTGSADLWVFGSKLSTDQRGTHTIFDAAGSSSYIPMDGSTWSITYGDQSSASGTVGTDTIVLGGLTVHNQAIESADKTSSEFTQQSSDGLLGLAYSSINTVQPTSVATPVENMIAQKDISGASQLFTAWFEPPTGNSWYSFGYIGMKISHGCYHIFPSTVATVGGKTVDLGKDNTCIADTGTTLTLLADQACKEIYSYIPGAHLDPSQGWIFPSSTSPSSLPAICFAVGDHLFQMAPSDLAFEELSGGMTFGGIQSNGNLGLAILGDTFIRGIYAIFDQGSNRFGAVQRPVGNSGQGMSSGIPITSAATSTNDEASHGHHGHHDHPVHDDDHTSGLHEHHGHERLLEHPAPQHDNQDKDKHWYDALLHHPKLDKQHDPTSDYSSRSSG
ncbi:hypothetical protein LTS14_009042 [Recurvomyces mirabilis]|uniref:uncharacterized protein n=1 Tax=Recurvomyces mirabilis TaxID=574656 RepID=UPI002DDFACEC|nr:hypothetical protein LTS14_009042 [Recurvomyces mirabilis]